MLDQNQDFYNHFEDSLRELFIKFENALDILEQQDKNGEHKKELDDLRTKLQPYLDKYVK